MEIQETTKKTLNFVYDSWVLDLTIPPLAEWLGDSDFREPHGYFDFYQRFFSEQLGYPRDIFTIKKFKIEDVYNNPDEMFYYPLKTNWGLSDIFQKTDLPKSINKCLVECENIKVLFIREHEPETRPDINSLRVYCKKYRIPENRFVIISNNPKIEQYKEEFKSEFIFHRTNLLQMTSAAVWNELESEFVPKKEGKFFCCFNKSPKKHRIATLMELNRYQILQYTNWSMLIDYRNGRDYTNTDGLLAEFQYYLGDITTKKGTMDSILSGGTRKSDYEPYIEMNGWDFSEKHKESIEGAGGEAGGIMVPENRENFEQSYVNIVTESYYDDNWDAIHVTEKSTRPFFYYQIPIIIATKGHIKFMEEEFGFDFFRDIIDHSYNDIDDGHLRFQRAINEIKRINKKHDEIKKFYIENQERFEKNKQIVKNLPNDDNDLKFFIHSLNGLVEN